ncbi:MAG: hypothetical protein OXK19_04775 [Candidatus Dadabacteria bacterium]|nr:hypothetical protein [Candidatus Dadabacteria bacterium]
MKERTASLYSVFTQGRKAVVEGLKGMSPYAEYAKLGLEKSKELTKRGYDYSLLGIRYSYERGKDGLYYVKIAKEQAVPVLSTAKNYTGSIVNLPTILPVLSQSQWLNYLETLTKSVSTNFDKALDAEYLKTYGGGPNHRLFDGGHTLGGAWSNIAEMCSKTGCSTREQINGYFGALWKDATTPKGLPFMTMEKQTYDSLADKLSNYGISKNWTYDALSYDPLEILGAGISVAAVVYFLKTEQVEKLSEALGAMGIVSVVSANPLLALVMVSSVAYAIATGTDLKAKAATEGVVKSSIISGAFVLLPGAFLLQVTVAVAIAVLLEKNMKDENYAFAKDYTMEKINVLRTWIPGIEKKTNARRGLRNSRKLLKA